MTAGDRMVAAARRYVRTPFRHFGRTPDGDYFPWERTDLVDALKAALA